MLFGLVLMGIIGFIFSNSMQVAEVSAVSSGRVLELIQSVLVRLGHPALAQRITMHMVRKMAHFCEYALEGFWLMLCLRVYTRRYVRHVSWPLLGGLLTALADETIQMFSSGRSSQITDIWLDFAGVVCGLLAALLLLTVCQLFVRHYRHRNED
ncbi:MAG: VanZ family protein [Faecalibacterium sp.]